MPLPLKWCACTTFPDDNDLPCELVTDGIPAVEGLLPTDPVAEGVPATIHASVRPRPEQEERNARRPSMTGFQSDVCCAKPSLTCGLVHQRSFNSFMAKYDTSHSKLLGSGSFGTVSTVRHRETGDTFAVKVIETRGANDIDALRLEIELHKQLDHPNICKILESFEDARSGRFYIIMEMLTGGMLVSRMKDHRHGYDEAHAAAMMEKMLSAVLYCHQHGIVHRDIKLDNMMFEDEGEDAELKLIDFGFAHSVRPGHEMMHAQLGTPSYMAPELWSEHDRLYDSSVDIWALGAVAYMLVSGIRPFHSDDKQKKASMIRHAPLAFPSKYWADISHEARDFCDKLMQKQPKDRLAASEAIKHPWITGRSRAHSAPSDAARALSGHTEIIKSLEEYGDADELKHVALEVIAFSTPPKKLGDLRRIFQTIDTDDSGTIDIGEFENAMKSVSTIALDDVRRIFQSIDVNDSGEIDYTEFLAATVSSHTTCIGHKSLRAAFSMLDSDGDGLISRSDLNGALEGLLSPASIDAVMKCADSKGGVSYRTFAQCVTGANSCPLT